MTSYFPNVTPPLQLNPQKAIWYSFYPWKLGVSDKLINSIEIINVNFLDVIEYTSHPGQIGNRNWLLNLDKSKSPGF